MVIPHINVHFLLYVFVFCFANDIPAIYFIFILDNRNDVRQKADLSNFFI